MKTPTFSLIQPKTGKILVFLSFLLVYILLVGSVTIANVKIEWIHLNNFNNIQDGAWLKSSCV